MTPQRKQESKQQQICWQQQGNHQQTEAPAQVRQRDTSMRTNTVNNKKFAEGGVHRELVRPRGEQRNIYVV